MKVSFSAKNLFIASLLIFGVWFIYKERQILSPFILAGVFAYIFNPLVSFFQRKLKVPRTLSVILIYVSIIVITYLVFSYIGSQLISEAAQLSSSEKNSPLFDSEQLSYLPEWEIAGRSYGLQTLGREFTRALSHTAQNIQNDIWPYFTLAASQLINVLVFLISAYYLLKEGNGLVERVKGWLSTKYHKDFDEILVKVNKALGDYLRGQLLLILVMSGVTILFLTIMGVRFAVVLGIVTGFLELIPYFGPLTATSIAALSVYVTGNNNFGLTPLSLTIIVAMVFFLFRQLEDYFVIPYILARATKLHPLVILFSVLAGGHLAGPLGFVLSVPIVATLRAVVPLILKKLS